MGLTMESDIKEEKIRKLALSYYSRQDIKKALFQFSQSREIVPSYFGGFGKRPDSLQYESDILAFIQKGSTFFHCSEELWKDPLRVSTELSEQELEELREGWDLLIDIDSKYLDYSKILAELLIKALEFHNVKNIGVKFSGSKGFHIIVPWKAFPKEIYGKETRKMFPEWPRLICQYLNDMTKGQLIKKITSLSHTESYVKDFEAPKKVMPDIVLVSSRHLFRMPYSLHEKTALSSVVIDKNQISKFQIKDANPLKVQARNFLPEAEENEAKELLLQALDWKTRIEKEKTGKKSGQDYKEVVIKDLTPNLYPPCILNILQGMKQDGRKRALFILINFFKSLRLSEEKMEEKIQEWNKKNYHPLKEGYIKSQLSWHKRKKSVLPPNCDKPHYKDLGICREDNFCKFIKNPLNYTIKKSFLQNQQKFKKTKKKPKEILKSFQNYHRKRKDFK